MDRRITVTYDVAASTRRVRTELWSATSRSFVLDRETVLPMAVSADGAPVSRAASCDDGLEGSWPSGNLMCLGFAPNHCVHVGSSGSDCDATPFAAIQRALQCATLALGCISRASPTTGHALAKALHDAHVEYACGNRCPAWG